jgi:hypothetical protein
VLPETLALMRLIDEHRPALMASLHNAEVGGVYHYLSRPEPALHPLLQAIPGRVGLTLHRGEPEAPWVPLLAEGIYRSLDIRDAYDHLELTGEHEGLAGGNSTGAYAARHGTLTLVSEVPYWRDDRHGDDTPGGSGHADLLAATGRDVADRAGGHVPAALRRDAPAGPGRRGRPGQRPSGGAHGARGARRAVRRLVRRGGRAHPGRHGAAA